MKHLLNFFALAIIFMASARVALASTIDGTVTFFGDATITSTGIKFPAGDQFVAIAGTDSFSDFTAGQTANFKNNFSFDPNLLIDGEDLVVTNESKEQLDFDVTSITDDASGDYTFLGELTLTDKTTDTVLGTSAAVALFTPVDGNTFSMTLTATPEPGSFLLLGTGLVGVAGLARRKFLRS